MDKTYTLVSMLVLASGCSPSGDDSEALGESSQALTSGHTYKLETLAHSGSCMDVAASGTADGTNIQEWNCNGTGAQSFQLQAIDSTWFKIVNTNSGKCVDVASNGTADGTNIQLWTCNGTGAQAWKFVPSGSFFTIVGQTSNKCIDVMASGTGDGTNIQLWSCNSTNAQNWNPADIGTGGGTGTGCNATTWACGPDAGCSGGPSYHTGDIVLYQANNNYYRAVHDNGGLDPTVSTFFWTPTTCGGGGDAGGGSGGGGGSSGIAGVVSESQFNAWFPSRNSFYTYAGLTSINNKYPDFANSSDLTIRKREVAALLANVSIETGDLVFVVEQNTANYCTYCNTSFGIPCPVSCGYYGRGPLQLSWNYNYKAAGDSLSIDLLNNPGTVQSNASVSWQTAAWFWNTQTGAGSTTPHNAVLQSSGSFGFGYTIKAINGALECPSQGGSNTASRDSRINKYKFFCDQLGVSYGNNISC
jgi:Chitinase class I/Ricin-type beta-trefoil lectin domain-like